MGGLLTARIYKEVTPSKKDQKTSKQKKTG